MPLMDRATIVLAAKVYELAEAAEVDVDGLNIEPAPEGAFAVPDGDAHCYCRLRLLGRQYQTYSREFGGNLGSFSGSINELMALLTVLRAAKIKPAQS